MTTYDTRQRINTWLYEQTWKRQQNSIYKLKENEQIIHDSYNVWNIALFRQERQTSFTINPHFRFADFHADF